MRPGLVRFTAWALALAALGAVFAAWMSPHLAFEFANQLWSCF